MSKILDNAPMSSEASFIDNVGPFCERKRFKHICFRSNTLNRLLEKRVPRKPKQVSGALLGQAGKLPEKRPRMRVLPSRKH